MRSGINWQPQLPCQIFLVMAEASTVLRSPISHLCCADLSVTFNPTWSSRGTPHESATADPPKPAWQVCCAGEGGQADEG